MLRRGATAAARRRGGAAQVFEVQESLESGQAEFGRKEDVFKRREESLKGKDAELQDSLVRFSKFLQENDQKRARADKRAADEAKVRAGKEREAEQLSAALAAVRVQTARAGEVAEKTRQYQRFLERVLEHAAQHTSAFTEVNDLLLRHAALHATNSDLKRHMRKCADEADATRAELQALRKNEVNEVLLLNNRIAQLKKELEDRRARARLPAAHRRVATHAARSPRPAQRARRDGAGGERGQRAAGGEPEDARARRRLLRDGEPVRAVAGAQPHRAPGLQRRADAGAAGRRARLHVRPQRDRRRKGSERRRQRGGRWAGGVVASVLMQRCVCCTIRVCTC